MNQLLSDRIEYKPGKYVTLGNATREQLEAAARLDEQRGRACDDLAAFYRFAAESTKPGETFDSREMAGLWEAFTKSLSQERVQAMISEERRLKAEGEPTPFRERRRRKASRGVLRFGSDLNARHA